MIVLYCLFFFSSRRRHTRYIGDWSSDVCSSDLEAETPGSVALVLNAGSVALAFAAAPAVSLAGALCGCALGGVLAAVLTLAVWPRSEERRVGKECGSGGSADPWKKRDW